LPFRSPPRRRWPPTPRKEGEERPRWRLPLCAERERHDLRQGTNKLTLTGVSPATIYFTDRPERIAGNMRTADFVPFWSKGKDSFLKDPPNADISIVEGDKQLRQVVACCRIPNSRATASATR